MPARLNNGNADCSDTVIDPGPSHKWITTWQNPTFCNQSVCFFHISLSVINILFKLFEWYNMVSIRMSFYLNRDIITLYSTKFTTNRKGYVDALLRARRRRRRSNWNFSPKLLCHHSLRLAPVFCPSAGFNLPARRNLSACSLWRKHLFSHPVRSSFLPWIPSKTLFSRICPTQFNVFSSKPDYNALR